jgi:hypothetical protein
MLVVGNVEAFETLFLNRFPNSTAHEPATLLGMDVEIQNTWSDAGEFPVIFLLYEFSKGLEWTVD